MRNLAIIAMASLFVSGALAEEPEPHWYAGLGEAGGYARWGIPESDAVGFEVACHDDGVMLRPALYAMEEPAQTPDIRFDVDGTDYVRDATLSFNELDAAWQASATVGRNDALIDAMRRGSKLSYDFDPPLREGDAFTLSLSGSAKAIDQALQNC
ncbi:invasion associated locus B family protein [Acuticoccus mangrovi]|uniref:Uncharacterized protein n=1 Tax=Acuticoccus mangrovi TaxID=2796142 RepID=A0A934ML67_9HYPH|nr:hypothetical protein [Acuticoccus mangrovi]MBJ3776084.1 hypothetical protein [Acuticoccus mangrovi]